jgi:hypothetical protein
MRSDMLGNIALASKSVRQGFWRSEIVSLESRNGPRSRCRDDVFTKQICVLAYGRRGVGLCRWRKAQSTNHVCQAPYCFSTKPIHEGSLLIRHIEFCGVDGSPYRPQIYITARIACAVATGRSPEASTPVAILSPNPLALPGTSQTRPWPSSIALF